MEQPSATRAVLELSPAEDFDRLAYAKLEIREEDGTLLHLVTVVFGKWDGQIETPVGRVAIEATLEQCVLRIHLSGARVAEPRLWPPADNIVKAVEQVVDTQRREQDRAGSDTAKLDAGLREATFRWEGRAEEREALAREERREWSELRRYVRTEGASWRPCWVFEHDSGLHGLSRYDKINLAYLEHPCEGRWRLKACLGPGLPRHVRVNVKTQASWLLGKLKLRVAVMRARKAILESFEKAQAGFESVSEETGT